MPADLDDLLTRSGGDPTEPLDVDELWTEGRRRRRRRRVSAAAGGLASLAVIAVAIAALDLGGPGTPEVAPLAPSADDEAVEEPAEVEPPDEEAGAVDDRAAAEAEAEAEAEAAMRAERDRLEAQRQAEEAEAAAAAEAAEETEATEGPTPDPAALEDPCAPRRGGEVAAFIDVVGPVDGQAIDGEIELVGCSSVYEGTVRYRVLAGSTVLVDSFTTATAGGPEIGEFRETIPVGTAGAVTLQVFWEDASNGSERDLVEIDLTVS